MSNKKGFVIGTSVISGFFIVLLILLPVLAFGSGFFASMLANKYILILLGIILFIRLIRKK